MRSTFIPLLGLLALVVGCAPATKTGAFEVAIHNQTTSPLAAGFVKNGPPLEQGWDSPEQIGIAAPQLSDKHWGLLIPPGQTKTLGRQEGSFEKGSVPFVRIYRGDLAIHELLAVNRDSPDRTAVPLPPGQGLITVTDEQGHLTARYERGDEQR